MRVVAIGMVLLALMIVLPQGEALAWPRAVLAVVNVDDATTAANGNQVAAPCVRTCAVAGVPSATVVVECDVAPYGCPFLWEAWGRVSLKIENLDTGESCYGNFPPPSGWCHIASGTVRFTLTAETTGSESIIAFH